MFEWLRRLGEGHARILWAQVSLLTLEALDETRKAVEQNRQAIERFDKSSGALANRIYWLTWGLFALTAVMTVFTVSLWTRG